MNEKNDNSIDGEPPTVGSLVITKEDVILSTTGQMLVPKGSVGTVALPMATASVVRFDPGDNADIADDGQWCVANYKLAPALALSPAWKTEAPFELVTGVQYTTRDGEHSVLIEEDDGSVNWPMSGLARLGCDSAEEVHYWNRNGSWAPFSGNPNPWDLVDEDPEQAESIHVEPPVIGKTYMTRDGSTFVLAAIDDGEEHYPIGADVISSDGPDNYKAGDRLWFETTGYALDGSALDLVAEVGVSSPSSFTKSLSEGFTDCISSTAQQDFNDSTPVLPVDDEDRKKVNLVAVDQMFPRAMVQLAKQIQFGGDKYANGECVWDRSKSPDELKSLRRHTLEQAIDPDDIDIASAIAWRALANLQKVIERNQ